MKKRILYIILTVFMLLSLSSCGLSNAIKGGAKTVKENAKEGAEELKDAVDAGKEAAKEAGQKPEKDTDAEKDADAPDENTEEDTSDETPMWKTLYFRLLDRLREDLPDDGVANEYTPDGYYLYDIDKDGIPEMIVKRGTCEADYNADIFVNDGYSAKPIEYGVGVGHTSFYTDPGENGIIILWGHMGSMDISKQALKDDTLTDTEALYSQTLNGEDEEYTPVKDVVPGSAYINQCSIDYNIYVSQYETIMDGMDGKLKDTTDRAHPDKDLKDAVDNIMNGSGKIVCNRVPDYDYGDPIGTVSFDELLAKADPYSEVSYEVESQEYGDLNGDGKQECVFFLKKPSEEEDRRVICILNLQDETMYGYVMSAMFQDKLADDGTFEQTNYDGSNSYYRMFFDHEESMLCWLDW